MQSKTKESIILYIEDDDITRERFSKYLKSQCKVLYVAKDGEEGLAAYKNFSPDIVITDIEMPKSNGLEMIKEIRNISLLTQIIIITAYKKPQYLMEAVNLQLVQYLIKPISLEKITNALGLVSIVPNENNSKKYFYNDAYYDNYKKEFFIKNKIINLSKYERSLINVFFKKHPAPISYDQIDEHVYDYSASKNAIKLLIGSLRDKVGKNSVVNVSGYGYRLNIMDEQ